MNPKSFSASMGLTALIALLPSLYGQGTVSFYSGGAFIATNSVPGGPSTGLTWDRSIAPNAFYYALFVAPTNQLTVDNTLAGWTFTGNYATNVGAGRLFGNYDTAPPNNYFGVVIPGYLPGGSANFVILGWSANVGHDWSTVGPLVQDGSIRGLGFFAISGIGVGMTLAGGATPPANVMGTGFPQEIPSFTLNAPIPEPATWPLLMAGGAVAWHFRRRSWRR
jgi:hypothetical protein